MLPSASPSAVLPGLSQAQTAALDGLSQSALNPESQANNNPGAAGLLTGTGAGSQTAATPESADSPSAYPSGPIPTSVQSTIEKAQFISTSIQPGLIPGYPSVEFPSSGISPAALWSSGWPQQAYYKQ